MRTEIESKVETWLPVFSGFYGTIWEDDSQEQTELDDINEQRSKKGLAPVEWDTVEWSYSEYREEVAKGVTKHVGEILKRDGFISDYTFQELRSPKEYNFSNDAINVEFTLTEENRRKILQYLKSHLENFTKYIENRYTSYDGFLSRYSNDVNQWLYVDETLKHEHQLGSILNFILLNENEDLEMDIAEDLTVNGVTVRALNYEKLTTEAI